MYSAQNKNIKKLTIYKKALEVFKLSRLIAMYITDDKDILSMYLSKRRCDKYADNLVMNALNLVPKIVETEIQEDRSLKLRQAKSLHDCIETIYQDCTRLEMTRVKGKDFIQLLKKELNSLRKIHKSYVSSLL